MSDSRQDKPAPSDAAQVHELAESFDASWQPEDWERMVELARQAPPHLAPRVAHELIAIDVQRRLAHHLTLPDVHSYLVRFPDLATDPQWQDRVRADLQSGAGTVRAPGSLPDTIGRYKVNSILPAGGEAHVYLCYHPDWRKQVVVKWMREAAATHPDWRERFARQGELLMGLEHANVVRVFDQGECEGRPFLVTEYIQGRTLEQYYRDVRPTLDRIVGIVAEVAAALEHAHRLGVYHQDVKPANILIDDGGRAKLIDFGMAWFRPAWSGGSDPHGCAAGTPCFLSPEQANDGPITARTDVFALGAILYFLLTGESLYPEPTRDGALRRARACAWNPAALDRPGIPVRLRTVCRTALMADPQSRQASATELAAAATVAIRPPWYRSPRRLAMAGLLLVVFGGAIAAGRALQQRWFPSPAAAIAEKANLVVRVRRDGFDPKPLGEVVPLRTGDSIQARFRVSPGTHVSLVSVDGGGRLELLQSYSPRESTYEAIWPGTGQGKALTPPVGTEFLFVCGRRDRPPTLEELQGAWNVDAAWPALEPKERLFRVRPEEITVEGASNRGFGDVVEFPEGDQVKRRLEQFRDRLREFNVLDGVAFRHQ